MSAHRLYRQDSKDAVVACMLDDIAVLYHRPSGQTHMVISPVPEILAALEDGQALTAADVHDRLVQNYDLGPRDEVLREIEVHLAGLAALGLVRAA